MKFFVDTGNIDEIRDLAETGLVDGVTTNPTLIAQTGRNFLEVVAEICAVVPGPVSAEVAATDVAGMLAEGRRLREIAPNVCIKVPLTWDGLKACRTLADEGAAVNVTLCFSPAQALLAGKAGAAFISPFVGRLDDIGTDGMQLIADTVEIFSHYDAITTEVLVASVRTPNHVIDAAKMGAHVVTPAAQGAAPAGFSPAHRQGARSLRGRLESDRSDHRLIEAEGRITSPDDHERGRFRRRTRSPARGSQRWCGLSRRAEAKVSRRSHAALRAPRRLGRGLGGHPAHDRL